jgi:hypothetical protein
MFAFVRRVVPWVVLVLVIGSLGLVAWATANPRSPALAAAEGWPIVGPAVVRFRRLYVPPQAPTPPARPEGGAERVVEYVPLPSPEAPRTAPVVDDSPRAEPVWLEPGMALRASPADDARALAEVPKYRQELPIVSRPPWYRVRLDGLAGRSGPVTGWVRVEREAVPGEPLLGRAPAPVLPRPGRPPERLRLARARALLHPEATGFLGPYGFYSDVTDLSLNTRLDGVARAVEPLYRRRFGLEPVGETLEAVVLFRREASYRSYQGAERRLAGLPAGGHAGNGMAVLYADDREPEEVAGVLLHELTHLLNRRALGPALPPWLDEGLAEDLGWSEIDASGRPTPGTWGGVEGRIGATVYRLGGRAVLDRYRLSRARGRLLPLADVLALDWEEFVRREDGLAYVQTGLLVRYLVESRHRDGFRRFLADTARGEPISAGRLEEALGVSLGEIERELDAWATSAPLS